MATDTQQTNARVYPLELVHYIAFTVNWNDAGIGASGGVGKQYLPAGAIVLGTDIVIDTVFNAGTTNVLTVGTSAASSDQLVNAAGVNEAATGLTPNIAPNAAPFLTKLTGDTQVCAKYTQTGTAATTGKAYVVVKYVPDIDSFK